MSGLEGTSFELDRLTSYDDTSVLAEMVRAAGLVSADPLTRIKFDSVSRVSSHTCIRRWGSWRDALVAAGIGDRAGSVVVTERMRSQAGRSLSADEVTAEIQRVASLLGKGSVTRKEMRDHSNVVSERIIVNRFGSWTHALKAAGLEPVALGRRWTDDDYFENILSLWSHYGRCPRYAELNRPPSRISAGGTAKKFGTWGRAKEAFVQRVNSDLADSDSATKVQPRVVQPKAVRSIPAEEQRHIPLGLRYTVLRRDRFRCVTCGRSPATDLTCILHIDHALAFARGGKTTVENLRTLCEQCNVGKGARPA